MYDVSWPDTSDTRKNTPSYLAFVAQCELTQIIEHMSKFGLSSFSISSQADLRERLEELATLKARLGAWHYEWRVLFEKYIDMAVPPGVGRLQCPHGSTMAILIQRLDVESLRLLYLHCMLFVGSTQWTLTLQGPNSLRALQNSRSACLEASVMLVEFVEGLTDTDLASYWPARNFCLACRHRILN